MDADMESFLLEGIIRNCMAMNHITIEILEIYRDKLIKYSGMTNEDIRDMWIEKDEINHEDLDNVVHHWNAPLYVKMLIRYRNCNKNAAAFFRQVDPNNQQILLMKFDLNTRLTSRFQGRELIEFFAWITNGLGAYDIIILEGLKYERGANYDDEKVSKYVTPWRKNPITWYFNVLDDAKRQELVDRYNKTCVDPWNDRK